jgi:hypothetical protein
MGDSDHRVAAVQQLENRTSGRTPTVQPLLRRRRRARRQLLKQTAKQRMGRHRPARVVTQIEIFYGVLAGRRTALIAVRLLREIPATGGPRILAAVTAIGLRDTRIPRITPIIGHHSEHLVVRLLPRIINLGQLTVCGFQFASRGVINLVHQNSVPHASSPHGRIRCRDTKLSLR